MFAVEDFDLMFTIISFMFLEMIVLGAEPGELIYVFLDPEVPRL